MAKGYVDQNKLEKFRLIFEEFYFDKKMTLNEISEETNITIDKIKYWFGVLNLSREMQYEAYKINCVQHDILIGSILGDGCVTKSKSNTYYHFAISHAENQLDYLDYKYKIFKNLCNIKVLKKKTVGKDAKNVQRFFWFYTKHLPVLTKYKDITLEEILENLNPTSLLIWYLDDGFIQGNRYSISVARFTEQELNKIMIYIKKEFGLISKIHWKNGKPIGIRFNTKPSVVLDDLFKESYLYGDLYKLVKYKLISYEDSIIIKDKKVLIDSSTISREELIKRFVDEGLTYVQVADYYNCHRDTIFNAMTRNGLNMKYINNHKNNMILNKIN